MERWDGEGREVGGGMEEIPQLNLPMVRVGGLSLLSTSANILDKLLYHMYACLTSMAESSNCSGSITFFT